MNKLQLYITKSFRGFKSLVNFNPSEDVRKYVHDLREALKIVNYDASEKNIFFLIKYIDEGVFFTIIRSIPDQPLDHLAAWVYVPNGLEISGDALESIIRLTIKKVSMSGVGESDLNELRSEFSKEYPYNKESASMVCNQGQEYAFAYYGSAGHALENYLGDKLFQPEFVKYKGVLLLDSDLGITGEGIDLTGKELQTIVTMTPPETAREGFVPYIYNRQFDHDYKVALGSKVIIKWKRAGFEDIEQEIEVTEDGIVPEVAKTEDSRKTISQSSFYVTSQVTKDRLSNCLIKVNGVDVTNGHTFTQSELSQATVWISCEGYFPYSGKLDLASSTQALIQLQERRKIYQFEIPLKSSEYGAPVKFEIRSKHELHGSPLDGYELLDELQEGPTRTNHLGYAYGAERKPLWTKLMYIGIGLVLGVVLMIAWGSIGNSGSSASNDSEAVEETDTTAAGEEMTPNADTSAEAQAQAEPAKKADLTPVTNADALKYLDENKVWEKAQLEKFAELHGLFDDLNNMNMDALVNTWGPKLKSSKTFSDNIVKAATHAIEKKVDLHRKDRGNTYNKEGDEKINWLIFTYWIDP